MRLVTGSLSSPSAEDGKSWVASELRSYYPETASRGGGMNRSPMLQVARGPCYCLRIIVSGLTTGTNHLVTDAHQADEQISIAAHRHWLVQERLNEGMRQIWVFLV